MVTEWNARRLGENGGRDEGEQQVSEA